jgi:hypothetical protein
MILYRLFEIPSMLCFFAAIAAMFDPACGWGSVFGLAVVSLLLHAASEASLPE